MISRKSVRFLYSAMALMPMSWTGYAVAADQAAEKAPAAQASPNEIVVTARRREERLSDIPISVTAVSGERLLEQQAYTVKDVGMLTPGLNIDSDSPTRAFVSIRGIGTTLVDSVQPGVGIFIDGIYQPSTSYLNSPLVDVERVEVLRGPQGTLFGNNTLGGAINVVTRQPSNIFHARFDATSAWQDDFKSISGSVSGPIVRDLLQFRLGAAYHHQDGFIDNQLTNGGLLGPATQKSVNGSVRILPTEWAVLTVNANYDDVSGGYFPYVLVDGPRDYRYTGQLNVDGRGHDRYTGVSLKGEFDVEALATKITLIGAYNRRKRTVSNDSDLGPTDFLRSNDGGKLTTKTAEIRFETEWSSTISSLVGLFYNKSQDSVFTNTSIIPANIVIPGTGDTDNRSKAVFATLFWKPGAGLEITVGGRYDSQNLRSTSAFTAAAYTAKEFQPRVAITEHWSRNFMTYASVSRGVRGGGQNPPGSPILIYRNDSVWTYEVGTKFSAFDDRLTVSADIFYNDYSDYIGPSAIVQATNNSGPIAVNVNSGDVESYGAEFESTFRITPRLRLTANVGWLHARTTDQSGFAAVTGFALPTNRLLYTPDYNYSVGANYSVPLDDGSLTFDANVTGKGSRPAYSYSRTTPTILDSYSLVNGSITYKIDKYELALFATNLFDKRYFTTYNDVSVLGSALPPGLANNVGVPGDRRRIGVRTSIRF